MGGLKVRLTSRKFWLTIGTVIAPFISSLHLTNHEKATILAVAAPIYVIVEGIVDAVRANNPQPILGDALRQRLSDIFNTAASIQTATAPQNTPPQDIPFTQEPPADGPPAPGTGGPDPNAG